MVSTYSSSAIFLRPQVGSTPASSNNPPAPPEHQLVATLQRLLSVQTELNALKACLSPTGVPIGSFPPPSGTTLGGGATADAELQADRLAAIDQSLLSNPENLQGLNNASTTINSPCES